MPVAKSLTPRKPGVVASKKWKENRNVVPILTPCLVRCSEMRTLIWKTPEYSNIPDINDYGNYSLL